MSIDEYIEFFKNKDGVNSIDVQRKYVNGYDEIKVTLFIGETNKKWGVMFRLGKGENEERLVSEVKENALRKIDFVTGNEIS